MNLAELSNFGGRQHLFDSIIDFLTLSTLPLDTLFFSPHFFFLRRGNESAGAPGFLGSPFRPAD